MKQFLRIIALFTSCAFAFCALQASDPAQEVPFKDKPALSWAEWIGLQSGKVAGAASGVAVGSRGGLSAGELYQMRKKPETSQERSPARKESGNYRPIMLGGVTGLVAGAGLGYMGGKALSIRALARLHGVSARIENISQFYDINISQYGLILMNAEEAYKPALLEAIDEVYSQRFGSNWRNVLVSLYNEYRPRWSFLLKYPSHAGKNARDFMRMIELGAAMANLYYKTKPNKKNTLRSAEKIYAELGLLNQQ